ncbi:putative Ig domain-containing protein [Chitinilyticum litopenaei]|uniref:putative Ig domain-containing protein n=1 Tax=Chitinilyticum litopenaei TaxID=1121276 RepID=UPI000427762D|nr:putative Ig domain-containing protein [Chitinilyticum litopenaei]
MSASSTASRLLALLCTGTLPALLQAADPAEPAPPVERSFETEFSANQSDPFGVIATGELTGLLADEFPLYTRLQLGSNYRELLVRAGMPVFGQQGLLVFTGRGLRARQDYQFGPALAEAWTSESTFGIDLSGKLFGFTAGAYGGYSKAPAKDLGSVVVVVDADDAYREYLQPRRLSGNRDLSGGLLFSGVVNSALRTGLSVGAQRVERQFSSGTQVSTGATASMGVDWLLGGGSMLNLNGSISRDAYDASFRLYYPLIRQVSAFVQCNGNRYRPTGDTQTACGVGLQYRFGGAPAITAFDTETSNTFSRDELLDQIRQIPVYATHIATPVQVDSSESPTLLTEISKGGLDGNSRIEPQSGDIIVTTTDGLACGSPVRFSRNLAGSESGLPLSLISTNPSATPQVIRFDTQGLRPYLQGSSASSPATLRAVFELCTVTLTGHGEQLTISSVSAKPNAADTPPTLLPPLLSVNGTDSLTASNRLADPDGLRNVEYLLFSASGALLASNTSGSFTGLAANTLYQVQTRAEALNKATGVYSPVVSPLGSAQTQAASPPLLANVPDQNGQVGSSFTLNLASYVTPTNGDAITAYTLNGPLPSGLSFNAATGVLSGTPTAVGVAALSFSATDKDGVSNSDSFVITIVAAPEPPLVADVPNQSGQAGTALSLNLASYVTPTNGDAISAYTLSGPLPAGLNFNSSSGILSGTPSTAGSATLSLSASDKDGVSNSDSFVLTIAPPPDTPPIVSAIANPLYSSGTFSLNLAPNVIPTNGDPILSYSLSGALPAGLSFNTATGLLSGVITETSGANFTVSFSATDKDGQSNIVSFTLLNDD